MIIITHGEPYTGNILVRSYINQSRDRNDKELFCTEVLTAKGFSSRLAGRYTSKHPQGAKKIAEEVVSENIGTKTIVQLSNEYENPDFYGTWLGNEFQAKSWFDGAFDQIKERAARQGGCIVIG